MDVARCVGPGVSVGETSGVVNRDKQGNFQWAKGYACKAPNKFEAKYKLNNVCNYRSR